MNPTKNKRVLFAACRANGIDAREDDAPADLMRRLLFIPSVATPELATPAPVRPVSVSVPDEKTFCAIETTRLTKSGVRADMIAKEVQTRWQFLKDSIVTDDIFGLPNDVVVEHAEQLRADGWHVVLTDRECTYHRKSDTANPVTAAEESAVKKTVSLCADAATEEKDTSALKDHDNIDKKVVASDTNELLGIIRQRIVAHLAMCPVLRNPHVDASKIAFAIIPTDNMPDVITPAEKLAASNMWKEMLTDEPVRKRHKLSSSTSAADAETSKTIAVEAMSLADDEIHNAEQRLAGLKKMHKQMADTQSVLEEQ